APRAKRNGRQRDREIAQSPFRRKNAALPRVPSLGFSRRRTSWWNDRRRTSGIPNGRDCCWIYLGVFEKHSEKARQLALARNRCNRNACRADVIIFIQERYPPRSHQSAARASRFDWLPASRPCPPILWVRVHIAATRRWTSGFYA